MILFCLQVWFVLHTCDSNEVDKCWVAKPTNTGKVTSTKCVVYFLCALRKSSKRSQRAMRLRQHEQQEVSWSLVGLVFLRKACKDCVSDPALIT